MKMYNADDYGNYDDKWFHEVELVIQEGEQKHTSKQIVGGNCAGWDVIECAISTYADSIGENGDSDWAYDEDEVKRHVVSAKIVRVFQKGGK